jgi:hypothetical protein
MKHLLTLLLFCGLALAQTQYAVQTVGGVITATGNSGLAIYQTLTTDSLEVLTPDRAYPLFYFAQTPGGTLMTNLLATGDYDDGGIFKPGGAILVTYADGTRYVELDGQITAATWTLNTALDGTNTYSLDGELDNANLTVGQTHLARPAPWLAIRFCLRRVLELWRLRKRLMATPSWKQPCSGTQLAKS